LDTSKNRLSKNSLWLLFSVCAFPVHVWTFILFFRDFSWISERTNSWDAFGVGAYGLLIAFIESVFIFLLAFILSFILPKKWSECQRVTTIGVSVLLVAIWTIIGQMYFLTEFRFPISWLTAIARNPHPLWVVYGYLLAIIVPTVFFPIYGIYKYEKFGVRVMNSFEALTTLTTLYLFLDVLGVIIVIIRNV
jgi:hypothetical protein